MYSQSNSYLGGANSGRPGPGGFGQPQQSFSNLPPAQQQQQPSPFAPQPTGYGGPSLQPQQTGYPGFAQQQSFQAAPQQPQFPGYPPQNQPAQPQQQFQQLQQPQQSQFQAPPPQQPPQPTAAPLRPQQTSAQMAQSFSSGASAPASAKPAGKGARIPNVRLSFITATDQAKFEQLFKSAAGDSQAISGEKARDLLLRSKLPGSALSQIWVLSDTTKSGQLLFPEFALAMYLCNLKLTGKDMPSSLPDTIKNEVSSMVDMISFAVPDEAAPAAPPRSNAPDFDAPLRQNAVSPPAPQAPRPQQASNQQLLSQLTSQPTGFYNQATGFQPGLQPQITGYPGQPQQGIQQGLQQPQPTGYPSNPQATGYTGPRPPMPPMPTGFQSGMSPQQTGPLQAQPTGIPGQWGFVNAPAGGLPNIDALKQRLMPQAGREGGFTTQGLAGSAQVPWAVTKDEKKIYDDLFKAWDGFNKGFITGDVAIELMGQSGLDRKDLESIWTLSDPNNKGRLNMDEFSVAMHLIYRKLNGYPVPSRLPPELIPPSTRNLSTSIDKVRSALAQDADARKQSGAFLQPQRTGVSYLKEHSFRGGSTSPGFGRKDATVFRNNDEEIGYRSSARRRIGAGGRTPSPAGSSETGSTYDDMSADQIRKKIRETKVLLDATDFQDERAADDDDVLDRRDKREAEDLFRQIRRIQDDIDTHPNAGLGGAESGAERRSMRRELQRYQDRLPQLASDVRKIEKSISETKLQLFRLKDAKANPSSAANIVGTGPSGSVTEADRIKARARARMQARAAELAGRPAPAADDEGAAQRRLDQETSKVKSEQDRNEGMTRDVEDSVKDFVSGLEDGLRTENESASTEHERRRWEEALGVEDEVKELIFDLQRGSRTARVRKEEQSRSARPHASERTESSRDEPRPTNGDLPARPAPVTTPSASSVTSGGTQQDRVASAKEKALKRIQDRMAAAGLKPAGGAGETAQQRQEREKQERAERVRKAEEEDAKREQERQQRLANEGVAAPPVPASPAAASPKAAKKPPPPPTSRKIRQDSTDMNDRKSAEAAARAKAEEEAAQEIRAEQEQQEQERKRLE
jgi:actin cytoskeleton-regulatory complex protein PAN1